MSTIGVLALQGGFSEHSAAITRLGAHVLEVRLPEQIDSLDWLIIPGGESTTIARLLERWALYDPIRSNVQQGLAVWGTCAGAILLANRAPDLDRQPLALMEMTVRRNAFGRQVDSFESYLDSPAAGFALFPAVFIRAPVIADIGEDATPLACLSTGEIVAVRQGNRIATAFHPELTGDDRLHQYFLDIVEQGSAGTESRERAATAT